METKNLREAAVINLLVKAIVANDIRSKERWVAEYRQEIQTPENVQLIQLLLGEKSADDKDISEQARIRHEILLATRRRPGVGRVRHLRTRPGRASRK